MSKISVHITMVIGLSLMLAVSGCANFQVGQDAYNRGD